MKSTLYPTVLCLAILCLTAAFSGCSQQTAVNADYDTSADFTVYKTYAWLDEVFPPDKVPEGLGAANDITDRRIRTSLNEEMAAKGFTANTSNPDILIYYHVGVEDKVDVTDWGYSYASTGRYGGWDSRNVDTYNYQEGSLVVDFVDAKSRVLVWRGTAQKVLDNVTAEEADQVIKDIVKEVMTLYPPTGQAPQAGGSE